jgi:hypothetical protein
MSKARFDDLPGVEQIAPLNITLAAIAIDHHDWCPLLTQRIERLDRAVEDRLTDVRPLSDRNAAILMAATARLTAT